MIRSALPSCWFALLCILVSLSPPYAFGQLTFKQLPGYQRYEEVSARRRELSGGWARRECEVVRRWGLSFVYPRRQTHEAGHFDFGNIRF